MLVYYVFLPIMCFLLALVFPYFIISMSIKKIFYSKLKKNTGFIIASMIVGVSICIALLVYIIMKIFFVWLRQGAFNGFLL